MLPSEVMDAAVALHHSIVRDAAAEFGIYESSTEGVRQPRARGRCRWLLAAAVDLWMWCGYGWSAAYWRLSV